MRKLERLAYWTGVRIVMMVVNLYAGKGFRSPRASGEGFRDRLSRFQSVFGKQVECWESELYRNGKEKQDRGRKRLAGMKPAG